MAIVFSAMAGLGLLLSLDKIPFSWLRRGLLRPLNDLAVDARRLFFAPGAAAFSVGLSLVVHFGSAMIVFVLALRMGIQIGALECVILDADRSYGETQIFRFSHGWLLARMVLFAYKKLKAL